MIRKEKIKIFQEKILFWFSSNGRQFYWRRKGLTNFQYIIAEALLQRTRAETVAKFYVNFINTFPNWKALANSNIDNLQEFLRPIGLYRQRAQRLTKLAMEMVKRNGKLPKNREDLESIPFMGQYTANAVELVIFNKPSPLVDVNMSRVLERIFDERKLADIRYDPFLQKLSREVVNHASPKEINWAILDFSALVCRPKPLCHLCLLTEECKAFKKTYSKNFKL